MYDMKTLTYTTAIVMTIAATNLYAHHPAADMVDADTYDMINENLEAADSPHLTMDLDSMGSASAIGDSAMDQATVTQLGPQSSQEQDGGAFDLEPPMEAANSADTIDLLENVAQ